MRTFIAIAVTYLVFLFLLWVAYVTQAHAHDVYNQLRSATGQLCCGGDPVTGDCEGIVSPHENVDGSATFFSKRYGASVLVAKDKITWLPVPGGEDYEAHWCGVPRAKVPLAPVNDDNPDPGFWTYCAFWAPGGV